MKIAVIIPDRGDRPEFLSNCLRMVRAQTLAPTTICLVDYEPRSEKCDISARYRDGYMRVSGRPDVNLIALMENDDWYAPDYLEVMASEWEKAGRPDIFGTNYTIYYHLRLRKYFVFDHMDRASAMNTFIKPNLHIQWPSDFDPYTDMHLWRQLKGVTIKPSKIISIGMKHGQGMTGGQWHNDRFERFTEPDNGLHHCLGYGQDRVAFPFLQSTLDPASFEFYDNLFPYEKELQSH